MSAYHLPIYRRLEPGQLQGRVVLVTGAGSGLGAALAREAGAAGATVVLLDKEMKALEAVYDAIEAGGGPQPALYPMDLAGASTDDYAQLSQRLGETFGVLHGLVHNAAELGRPAPLDYYRVDAWYRTMQVNVNAPFQMTQACLPLLREADDASLVFVSDAAGRRGKAYQGAYGVAKFALEGLMQVAAHELADTTRICACSVDPGPMRTAMRRDAYPGEHREHLNTPEDVARPIATLLLSDGCPWHGRALTVTQEE